MRWTSYPLRHISSIPRSLTLAFISDSFLIINLIFDIYNSSTISVPYYQAAKKDMKPGLAKRLYVLSALEIERHRKITIDQATQNILRNTNGETIAQVTAATLDTLMMTSLDTQATQVRQVVPHDWLVRNRWLLYLFDWQGLTEAGTKKAAKVCLSNSM